MAQSGCIAAIRQIRGMVERKKLLAYLYWRARFMPDSDRFFHDSSGRLNQEALARDLRVSAASITRLIDGKHEVGKTFLLRVLEWSGAGKLERLLPLIGAAPPVPEGAFRQKIAD